MSRQIDCPYPDIEAHIELPDTWLGIHAERRDEAVDKMRDQYGRTLQNFGISLALLDDWSLPGLNGNPEKWDFNKMDLRLVAWVTNQTLTDFLRCWTLPKDFPLQSQSGLIAAGDVQENGVIET